MLYIKSKNRFGVTVYPIHKETKLMYISGETKFRKDTLDEVGLTKDKWYTPENTLLTEDAYTSYQEHKRNYQEKIAKLQWIRDNIMSEKDGIIIDKIRALLKK